MIIQAEVSLYPLGEQDLAPFIYTFVRRLERPGLHIDIGRMSSVVTGESQLVFQALRDAYEEASIGGARVLVIKMLNDKSRMTEK